MKNIKWNLTKTKLPKWPEDKEKTFLIQHHLGSYSTAYWREGSFCEMPHWSIAPGNGYIMPKKWVEITA